MAGKKSKFRKLTPPLLLQSGEYRDVSGRRWWFRMMVTSRKFMNVCESSLRVFFMIEWRSSAFFWMFENWWTLSVEVILSGYSSRIFRDEQCAHARSSTTMLSTSLVTSFGSCNLLLLLFQFFQVSSHLLYSAWSFNFRWSLVRWNCLVSIFNFSKQFDVFSFQVIRFQFFMKTFNKHVGVRSIERSCENTMPTCGGDWSYLFQKKYFRSSRYFSLYSLL